MHHARLYIPRILFVDFEDTAAARAVVAVAGEADAGVVAQAYAAIGCREVIAVRMSAADAADVLSLQNFGKKA